MNKSTRQYIGLLVAIMSYYLIHEGAHLVYALCSGVFKRMNFIGLGIQIDVYAEQMTSNQLGVFCITGESWRDYRWNSAYQMDYWEV